MRVAAIVILTLIAASGCSDYDTHTIGQNFAPANSLVSQFVHPVYVEYREGGVRIWGPWADAVVADVVAFVFNETDDSMATLSTPMRTSRCRLWKLA